MRPSDATLWDALASVDRVVRARTRTWKLGVVAVKFAVSSLV